MSLAALSLVVLAAFAVETALGFGGTLITVSIGALIAPLDQVLAAFIPVNVALSLYITVRHRADVDRRLLLGRIAPLMGLGLPVGIAMFHRLGAARLSLALGLFVAALSLIELARGRAAGPPPGRATSALLLIAAGVIHGALATGGPLAVYVVGRELADKARFRATLSALWLVLNLVLLISYLATGTLGRAALGTSAVLALPLVVGIGVGEWAHRSVPEGIFRRLVFLLLFAAGAALAARSA